MLRRIVKPSKNKRKSAKYLKGPKHEIFGFGFFTYIKPIWIGDLGNRQKKYLGWFGSKNRHFVLFSAVGYSAKEF
jgi:hypothetical protein